MLVCFIGACCSPPPSPSPLGLSPTSTENEITSSRDKELHPLSHHHQCLDTIRGDLIPAYFMDPSFPWRIIWWCYFLAEMENKLSVHVPSVPELCLCAISLFVNRDRDIDTNINVIFSFSGLYLLCTESKEPGWVLFEHWNIVGKLSDSTFTLTFRVFNRRH